MPTVDWNAKTWESYNWPESGDEWSSAWGNSRSQWFSSLYPRLHGFLPATNVLEIAPGFGRWSQFLIPNCQRYVGVDLSHSCVETCRRRFAGASNASFFVNDGYILPEFSDVSLIFSFDSLVHADLDVFAAYIPQILSRLAPNG